MHHPQAGEQCFTGAWLNVSNIYAELTWADMAVSDVRVIKVSVIQLRSADFSKLQICSLINNNKQTLKYEIWLEFIEKIYIY